MAPEAAHFLAQVVEQARAQSLLEVVAVVAAILYLVLAIRQNIACWFFAAISTSVYVYLFVEAKLYMESLLNVFYLGMAFYGWYVWSRQRPGEQRKAVTVWPFHVHIVAIVAISLLATLNGYWLHANTDAAYPYIDSLTTWFAIWATYLVAEKVLENWWYWLAIDVVAIFIYWSRDLQLTSVLFVLYVLMIPFGLRSWMRSMPRAQS